MDLWNQFRLADAFLDWISQNFAPFVKGEIEFLPNSLIGFFPLQSSDNTALCLQLFSHYMSVWCQFHNFFMSFCKKSPKKTSFHRNVLTHVNLFQVKSLVNWVVHFVRHKCSKTYTNCIYRNAIKCHLVMRKKKLFTLCVMQIYYKAFHITIFKI
jgi:hypothetical protein